MINPIVGARGGWSIRSVFITTVIEAFQANLGARSQTDSEETGVAEDSCQYCLV